MAKPKRTFRDMQLSPLLLSIAIDEEDEEEEDSTNYSVHSPPPPSSSSSLSSSSSSSSTSTAATTAAAATTTNCATSTTTCTTTTTTTTSATTTTPPTNAHSADDFEKVLDTIGGHGRFQLFLCTVTIGSMASVAMVFLFMSFGGTTPDFWCSSGFGGNDSEHSDDDALWKKLNRTRSDLYKACHLNGTPCLAFVFEDSVKTIVSQWSLVCSRKWISSTSTSVQMAGVLLGALTAGQAADVFGRRITCILLLTAQAAFCFVNAFSPNWTFFIVTRFGAGFCGGGYLVPSFSLSMEFVDIKWRGYLGGIASFSFGAAVMALSAWLLRDWQHLNIAAGIFTTPFIVGWWFVPESVRWLLVCNRVEEAQEILCRVARWNSGQAPEAERTQALARAELTKAAAMGVYTFADLFRTKDMIKTTCTLCFVWFTNGAVFYFLALGVETLAGNLYLNIFLMAAADVPAVLLSASIMNRIGRRWTGSVMYMIGGLCSLMVIILMITGSSGRTLNGFAVAAKTATGGVWAALVVISVESFPTVVRNIGYGACNVFSRVGTILAPQLVFIYDADPLIPYAVITLLMAISSLCMLTIRETNDQALEDVLPSRASSSATTRNNRNNLSRQSAV